MADETKTVATGDAAGAPSPEAQPGNFFEPESPKNRDARDFLEKGLRKLHGDDTEAKTEAKATKPAKKAAKNKPTVKKQDRLEPPPMDAPPADEAQQGEDGDTLGPPPASDDDEAQQQFDEPDGKLDGEPDGETEEQPEELDDRLVRVALSFGIREDELDGLTNESLASVLTMISNRMRGAQAAAGQAPPTPEGDGAKAKAADKKAFRFEYNRDDVGEEANKVIDAITDRYEQKLEEMQKALSDHSDWRKQFEKAQADARAENDRREFKGAVQKFTKANPAFAELFGDGSLERTTPQQRKALSAVAGQMDILARGYQFSRGTTMPPMERMFEMAVYALHGDRMKTHAQKELAGQLTERARAIQPQGSGLRSHRNGESASGDEAAKAFLTTHGRKLGLW